LRFAPLASFRQDSPCHYSQEALLYARRTFVSSHWLGDWSIVCVKILYQIYYAIPERFFASHSSNEKNAWLACDENKGPRHHYGRELYTWMHSELFIYVISVSIAEVASMCNLPVGVDCSESSPYRTTVSAFMTDQVDEITIRGRRTAFANGDFELHPGHTRRLVERKG
jgi:hypothetical protein